MESHFRFGRLKSPRGTSLLGLTVLLTLGSATDTAAQSEWARSEPKPGRPSSPTYTNGLIVHAISGVIYLRYSATGNVVGIHDAVSIIWRSPVLTALPLEAEESWYVFATTEGGKLIKLDVPDSVFTGGSVTILQLSLTNNVAQQRDLQRPGCTSDTLLVEPIVQRRADSNEQFTLEKDIVMVATAHGCGDTTQNQVVAFDAADIMQEPLWIFNYGEAEVGKIRACLLNLSLNLLHCVTEHPENSSQNSLWTLDTRTGAVVWAAISDAGVHARPALGAPGGPGEGHLYVGDQSGRIHTFDAADGTPVYDALDLPYTIQDLHQPPAVDFDLNVGTGDYAGAVLAVDSNGRISGVYDVGTEILVAWDTFPGAGKFVTEAVPREELHLLYVGSYDGSIHQLDLGTGAYTARARLAVGSFAGDETMTLALYQGDDGVHRLLGTHDFPNAGVTLTLQWKLPCAFTSIDCTWLPPVPPVIFINGFE